MSLHAKSYSSEPMTLAAGADAGSHADIERWFQLRGWRCFAFQRRAWRAWQQGRSGLIHSPTGSGKTMAAWGGPLQHLLAHPELPGLRLLWITPLRALAADTEHNLNLPLQELGSEWRVASRTGDSSSYQKQKLQRTPPRALITTPESLALMLSYADAPQMFHHLDGIVIDEWHELMDSKRGVLLQLALARLRRWCPRLRCWGMSATLANVELAARLLLSTRATQAPLLIQGNAPRRLRIDTLLPADIQRFPFSGHLGLQQLRGVLQRIQQARSTLLFTNTRAQAELWHQAIDAVLPGAAETLGLHHGSLDRGVREDIEQRLRQGTLRCVVATSSLDLGVDFAGIDQVMQIGSPKGAARLLQRAGRSGHRPGAGSHIICVPTHAMEVLEMAAARHAIEQQRLEPREPPGLCLDVLAQHLVSCALSSDAGGRGFAADDMLAEVRDCHAYRALSDTDWNWTLQFITAGGSVLDAYPDYHKVSKVTDVHGRSRYVVQQRRIASQHRMSIGTISADGVMQVRLLRGGKLGTVEESFVARLRPGDHFLFAGRNLQLQRVRDMTVWVKPGQRRDKQTPRWAGGRMPLSSLLADEMLQLIEQFEQGEREDPPELACLAPLLTRQQQRSALPARNRLLIETSDSREGRHVFLYPFAGRLAHEGLAMLLAWRMARSTAMSFSFAANDYGLELLTDSDSMPALSVANWRHWLRADDLLSDIEHSLNAAELARRHFRDIARIAGLVFPGRPGQHKSMRQIHASASLIYTVLSDYDAQHRLLQQARLEALQKELDWQRLQACLNHIAGTELVIQHCQRLTPLAFPLWAERQRGQLSSEDWQQRVQRMLRKVTS